MAKKPCEIRLGVLEEAQWTRLFIDQVSGDMTKVDRKTVAVVLTQWLTGNPEKELERRERLVDFVTGIVTDMAADQGNELDPFRPMHGDIVGGRA